MMTILPVENLRASNDESFSRTVIEILPPLLCSTFIHYCHVFCTHVHQTVFSRTERCTSETLLSPTDVRADSSQCEFEP